MPSTTSKSKATVLAAVQALIAGTQKHFPNGSFTLGNTAYTTSSLVALLQSVATALTALNTAQVAAKHALSTSQGVLAQVDPVIQIYVHFLQATFANTAPTLADFGLEPRKVPTPLTSEEKAASAAKAKATRQARGTTSKKQKLTVTGNVTGITVTPIIAPTAAPPAEPVTPVTPATPSAQTAPTPSIAK
jgi:ABC-type transporter Mla subunit MlaD